MLGLAFERAGGGLHLIVVDVESFRSAEFDIKIDAVIIRGPD
jgi:hypothetical protein